VFSAAQSISRVSAGQYGSSARLAARGSVPVTISPSSSACHSASMLSW
jgi:hypothetical protein